MPPWSASLEDWDRLGVASWMHHTGLVEKTVVLRTAALGVERLISQAVTSGISSRLAACWERQGSNAPTTDDLPSTRFPVHSLLWDALPESAPSHPLSGFPSAPPILCPACWH
jgi:hypothetical protein